MSLSTIFSLGMTYSTMALAILMLVLSLYGIAYHVIYRKLLKGKKKPPYGRLFWWSCLFIYVSTVLGVTLFFRAPMPCAEPVYPLFYSYFEADCEAAWRNIILNYCMFMPLGFWIPLGIKHFRSGFRITLLGFCFSLMIETSQLLLHLGMFEMDDLLGNTVGTLIGYGFFYLCSELVRRIKNCKPHLVKPSCQNAHVISLGSRARTAR